MVAAIQLGRGGSTGFPGKNTYAVLGRPMMSYALLAAQNTPEIDEIYVSTDDDEIKKIGREHGAKIIDRPDYLCTASAKHVDAMLHAYNYVSDNESEIEFIVLLQCNAPFILSRHLSEGIGFLREHPEYDSAATVSEYSAFTPARARLIKDDGELVNFMPQEAIQNANSERDSMGKVYFTDGTFIVRPRCFENIKEGLLPYPWMGKKFHAVMNWGGFDIDYEWQIPQVEAWLLKEGFTDNITPYNK